MGKKKSMRQQMQSIKANDNQAEETKQNMRSTEPGFHEPNRPSI
jgi:hypothetical protein